MFTVIGNINICFAERKVLKYILGKVFPISLVVCLVEILKAVDSNKKTALCVNLLRTGTENKHLPAKF